MAGTYDPRLQRERAVYDYLDALESGDIDVIMQVLNQALYDASLDQMVIEAHQAFFQTEAGPQTSPGKGETLTPALEPATLRSRSSQPERPATTERGARWMQALAAIVLVSILVGSLVLLLAIRWAPRPAGHPGLPAHPHALTCTAGSWSDEIDTQQQGALADVAAVSPTNVWAVGTLSAVKNEHRNAGLIEHWDGSRWTVSLITAQSASLHAVAAVSSSNVWAVGEQFDRGTATTLIEHWNGQRWSAVPSPDASPVSGAQNKLTAITASSANDIWAVGEVQGQPSGRWTLIEHWDGRHWQLVPDQGNQFQEGTLLSVTAFSAGNVWAAGNTPTLGGPMPTSALLEHWDGQRWRSTISSPGLTIVSISAISSTDIWAIGNARNSQGQTATEMARWDGHLWHSVPRLQPAYDPLQTSIAQIVAVNDHNAWLAGWSAPGQALVAHWDGYSWSLVVLPHPANSSTYVYGLAVSDNTVWIVGLVSGNTGPSRPLFEQQFRCR
jgi:hypothetical protein